MDEIISSLSLQESEEDLEGDEEDLIVMRLVREIQEKDGQLQMAAEIGQTLLEKNEKLAEQVCWPSHGSRSVSKSSANPHIVIYQNTTLTGRVTARFQ
eukprot:SAG31_NODE_1386_length_8574_cov_2.055037_11_plen_98_part_00